MYNFTIPTQLKAWIDRIVVAGKTFKYDANGVRGLAAGKRVIIALSRANFYVAGAPSAGNEHVETYLRSIFEFIGVTDIEVIVAEGVNIGDEQREKAISDALRAAAVLRAA
jgi:FMN-dependent NADH-azoreductase